MNDNLAIISFKGVNKTHQICSGIKETSFMMNFHVQGVGLDQ